MFKVSHRSLILLLPVQSGCRLFTVLKKDFTAAMDGDDWHASHRGHIAP
jgi:hypothetical protein